ncbi:MAG: hypothetical protein HY881_17115 [Deltaproteobacteria bacterium]|nr:hypothetical protein [Deltaproteobacteria bacterium]
MTEEKPKSGRSFSGVSKGVVFLAIFLAVLGFWFVKDKVFFETQPQIELPAPVRGRIYPPVIDYSQIHKDGELQDLMKSRKTEYGVDSGVDMIAKPEETLKVGDAVVPMKEILDKIRLNQRQVTEADLAAPLDQRPADVYGIHVVKPGDSIWKIHFNLLKGYFAQKGIVLSRWADEPVRTGKSSGVGRILKFSETMVSIYNVKERKLETNLNLLQPDSKIAVFNIGQALDLFKQIDYRQVNRVRFDGKNLWVPAEQ